MRGAALVPLVLLAACPKPLAPGGDVTTLYLQLGDQHVATVHERVLQGRVERDSQLVGLPDEQSHTAIDLDADGFVRAAHYRRTGKLGDRSVELDVREGAPLLRVDGAARTWPIGDAGEGVVTFESLRLVASRLLPTSARLLDLSSGESARVTLSSEGDGVVAVDEHGVAIVRATRRPAALSGPGAFHESAVPGGGVAVELRPQSTPPSRRYQLDLGDPTLARIVLGDAPGQRLLPNGSLLIDPALPFTMDAPAGARDAAPFLEADDPAVRAFAAEHAGDGAVVTQALALAEAIHEVLDTSRGGGPPSARNTLRRRAGDCDDATALLVAALRARGHAALSVSGYRFLDGRFSPHAWAMVQDEQGRWWPVDALVPGVGPFATHIALFLGVGSPLTIGRVLGRFRPRITPTGAED